MKSKVKTSQAPKRRSQKSSERPTKRYTLEPAHSSAGLPWKTREQKEEFIEAVAEAVGRALWLLNNPVFVVDSAKIDFDVIKEELKGCRPGRFLRKK